MKIAGLKVTFHRSVYPAFAVFGAIPAIVRLVYSLIKQGREPDARSWAKVPLLGVCFVASHIVGQFAHQLGHALMARLHDRPMTGVRYELIFSFSEYPADEPAAPPSVHIQRSLGGFAGALAYLAGVVALWSRLRHSPNWFGRWVSGVVLVDALILNTGSVLSDVMYVVERGWETKDAETPSSE